MTAQRLTGADLLLGDGIRTGFSLVIEGGRIGAVLPEDAPAAAPPVRLPPGTLLAPGLIDLQVNGGGGVLFNDDPTPASARAIAAAHRGLGTTGVLPTLITDTPAVMRAAAEAARQAVGQSGPGAGVLGVHFEGPFLSPRRPGVHRAGLIRRPGAEDVRLLAGLARDLPGPVVLTLAPEEVEDDVLRALRDAGVVLCAGHSAAGFERAATAAACGVRGFTHLFNAMPPLAAREPGIAAAALLGTDTWCGVIADGIHVHPAMLRLLLGCRGADRVFLVSDAMPVAGTARDRFELQGRIILRRCGRLETEDGTLAGADLDLLGAVRRLVGLAGVAPAVALRMASAVPAAFLGIAHERGGIAPGLAADLILLGPDLELLATWVGGRPDRDPAALAPVLRRAPVA